MLVHMHQAEDIVWEPWEAGMHKQEGRQISTAPMATQWRDGGSRNSSPGPPAGAPSCAASAWRGRGSNMGDGGATCKCPWLSLVKKSATGGRGAQFNLFTCAVQGEWCSAKHGYTHRYNAHPRQPNLVSLCVPFWAQTWHGPDSQARAGPAWLGNWWKRLEVLGPACGSTDFCFVRGSAQSDAAAFLAMRWLTSPRACCSRRSCSASTSGFVWYFL